MDNSILVALWFIFLVLTLIVYQLHLLIERAEIRNKILAKRFEEQNRILRLTLRKTDEVAVQIFLKNLDQRIGEPFRIPPDLIREE